MSRLPIIAVFMFLCCQVCGCETERDIVQQDWLAVIGKTVFLMEDVRRELEMTIDPEFHPAADSEEEKAILIDMLDRLVTRKLLVLEAERKGVVVSPDEIRQGMELLEHPSGDKSEAIEQKRESAFDKPNSEAEIRETLLAKKLLEREVYPRILVKDDEIAADFERDKERYHSPETIRVRQIVVKTEEEAQQVRRRLWRREPFHKVAYDVSIMPERANGGDLGRVGRKSLPEPFGDMVFELQRGVVSPPIKSQYGYHIFLVSDYRRASDASLEDVRQLVKRRIFEKKKKDAETELIEKLRERFALRLHPDWTRTGE